MKKQCSEYTKALLTMQVIPSEPIRDNSLDGKYFCTDCSYLNITFTGEYECMHFNCVLNATRDFRTDLPIKCTNCRSIGTKRY